jgi:hypothetical protein
VNRLNVVVSAETHKKLVKIKGKLMIETGRLVSLDDVIVYLLKEE